MKKVAIELVESQVLEGQKKLDAALMKARDDFDAEMDLAIKDTVQKQKEVERERERCQELAHKKHIIDLEEEWKNKMEVRV